MKKPLQVVKVFVIAINQVLEVTSFEFCFSMIGAELMSIPYHFEIIIFIGRKGLLTRIYYPVLKVKDFKLSE